MRALFERLEICSKGSLLLYESAIKWEFSWYMRRHGVMHSSLPRFIWLLVWVSYICSFAIFRSARISMQLVLLNTHWIDFILRRSKLLKLKVLSWYNNGVHGSVSTFNAPKVSTFRLLKWAWAVIWPRKFTTIQTSCTLLRARALATSRYA